MQYHKVEQLRSLSGVGVFLCHSYISKVASLSALSRLSHNMFCAGDTLKRASQTIS